MVVIEFKLPHGLKAKVRRDGYSIVKYSNQPAYRLRKKNSPKIGKNHHKFGNIMQELKIAYRNLSNRDKQALRERKKSERNTKSDWIQFIREYYRKANQLVLKEKRKVENEDNHLRLNQAKAKVENEDNHLRTNQAKRKNQEKNSKNIGLLKNLIKVFQNTSQILYKKKE